MAREQEELERLEKDVMEATIEARKKAHLSQKDLEEKTGITQPVISRIESGIHSPHTSTLIKLLYNMGYTLQVVPLDKKRK